MAIHVTGIVHISFSDHFFKSDPIYSLSPPPSLLLPSLPPLLSREVTVQLPGGDLQIEWRKADDHVYMTGKEGGREGGRERGREGRESRESRKGKRRAEREKSILFTNDDANTFSCSYILNYRCGGARVRRHHWRPREVDT